MLATPFVTQAAIMELVSEPKIQPMESKIKVHMFTTTICERLVKFEVIKFKDSLYIWIGEKRNRIFDDLSLALATHCSREPVCTKIMGSQTNLTSDNLAMKLSKRLNKPVYVSFNLTDDRMTISVVNNRIAEEIQNNPEHF